MTNTQKLEKRQSVRPLYAMSFWTFPPQTCRLPELLLFLMNNVLRGSYDGVLIRFLHGRMVLETKLKLLKDGPSIADQHQEVIGGLQFPFHADGPPVLFQLSSNVRENVLLLMIE